jgi:hypothetical protein
MQPNTQQGPAHGEEQRRREALWRDATSEVIETATERYNQIAGLLGLGPAAARAFVSAAMEATRQYQTGYMYANYERRTGHPFPDEGRENEEAAWAAAWSSELAGLEAALNRDRR